MTDKFRFGPFRFDQLAGVLRVHEGGEVHLGPRERRALECLLENRGRRVTYEVLANAVWGKNGQPDDAWGALHNVVLRIKKVLRQHGAYELGNLIQPQAKSGYLFTWHGPGTDEGEDLTPGEQRALQTYVTGIEHLKTRNVETMLKAMELFGLALSYDRRLAPALRGMADCLFLLGTAPYATLDPREAFPKAAAYAQKALKLATVEADIVSARTTLAAIDMLHYWNWKAAGEAFKNIVADHPEDGRARQFYAHLLLCTGRRPDALRQIGEATKRAAASPIILMTEGLIQYFSENFTLAAETFAHTANLHPRFSPAQVWVGVLTERAGKIDEAIAAFETAFSIEDLPLALASLGYLYARQGDQKAFSETLKRVDLLKLKRRISPWFYALMYAGANDSDQVQLYLEEAVEERCDFLIHCALEPRFKQFRLKDWFATIVRRIFDRSADLDA